MIIIPEKEQPTKHDEGYKGIFSEKENFLHFLKKYIDVPWTKDISADDMVRIEKSFITPEFQHIDSDIIYKLRLHGSDVYFYVLLELQSAVDFTMSFRLLRYMVELLADIFKNTGENERSRKDFRLPAIVPIILYNGEDNWTAVREYREYTENFEIFGNNIINFEYLLFDLNRKDKEFVNSTRKLVDLIFWLDILRIRKNMNDDKLSQMLSEYNENWTDSEIAVLINWIKYVLAKGNMSPELEEELKQAFKKGGEHMTHSIERLRDDCFNDGIQAGIQTGIQTGIQKGRQEGSKKQATATALEMLKDNMPIPQIVKYTGLSREELEALRPQ